MPIMRKDDERWPDEIDVDRVRAAPRSIAGAWIVAGLFAVLMLVVPPSVEAVDVALDDVRQDVAKVERHIVQVLPRAMADCPRPG
jgi:hypothetical protein